MIEWFQQGGVSMWPVLVAGLLAVGLAVDAVRRMPRADGNPAVARRVRGRIDAVLFWGVFAAVVGLIGTVVGVALVAEAASRAAGAASAGVVWGGIEVALHTTTFGLAVLLLSLGLWFALRTAFRRRVAAAGA